MYGSLQELCELEEKSGKPFWKIVQEDDCREQGITEEVSFEQMRAMYQAMKDADARYDEKLKSESGLVGTEGKKMMEARAEGTLLCGDFIGKVMEKALKTSESNACMKRIVAAPTAGSCGVVPAGAAGGCQAEIGSASAMAAGGVVHLSGGSAKEIANAAALALKNLLGLACDPVAGLVEVPCVKRNVMGAVNALTSADLTSAGIFSKIPPDEVIDAMRSIGRSMSEDIRETGKGGLAGTPTGVEIRERMAGGRTQEA